MELIYDISENEFINNCADKIIRSGTTIFEDIYESLSKYLISPIDDKRIIIQIINHYKTESYDEHLSLLEYINKGFLGIYYSSIDLYTKKDNPLNIEIVKFPKFLKLENINYGGGIKKNIKIKSYNLKTKNRINVEFIHLTIPKYTLEKIYKLVQRKYTNLIPSKLGVWEWRQTFYDKISGESFFCDCFKKSIQIVGGSSDKPHLRFALNNNSFKEGICHLCSGTNSDLFYCHPMYASSFKVKYGAYIRKFEIEDGLNEKDAENKVREI